MSEGRSRREDRDRALAYLAQLREETMRRAWGDGVSTEYRRRIVTAAIIFGRQFERLVAEHPAETVAQEPQRFLMALMADVVEQFALHEDLDSSEAANFLSETTTRDHVLELNEVLDACAGDDSGRTLDDFLREAVDGRRDRAIRARR